MAAMTNDSLTTWEIGRLTGYSYKNVRVLIQRGYLSAVKAPRVGGGGPSYGWRVSRADVERWCSQREDLAAIRRRVAELHRQGLKINDIAQAVNRSRRTIYRILRMPITELRV